MFETRHRENATPRFRTGEISRRKRNRCGADVTRNAAETGTAYAAGVPVYDRTLSAGRKLSEIPFLALTRCGGFCNILRAGNGAMPDFAAGKKPGTQWYQLERN